MARTRTFRLPESLLTLLQERARERGESANAVAERCLEEGLRRDTHPLIDFWDDISGRRAMILGTRLEVGQVIDTWLLSDKSVAETAAYLSVPEHFVAAALRYYSEFQDEIDEHRARSQAIADREEAAWRRERALLG
jgi:hypothetical protein